MLTLILAAAFSATLGLQQSATPARPDPREKLDTAIAEGIRLLETKDYVKFLSTFVPPEVLAARGKSIEEFAAEFSQGRAVEALAALKYIQSSKPAMSADGTSAFYEISPPPERGPRSMTWSKIGKYWYITK